MKKKSKFGPLILGIDPGLSGAFVLTDGKSLRWWPMPVDSNGKDRLVSFNEVLKILDVMKQHHAFHVALERALPMAMGSKHAFNYGRGFAALEIAIDLLKLPVTYVEPQKWAKEMHSGISVDLKPKAKSLIAAKRLFPHLVAVLPVGKQGKVNEGPLDALLIAAYGLRKGFVPNDAQFDVEQDFF